MGTESPPNKESKKSYYHDLFRNYHTWMFIITISISVGFGISTIWSGNYSLLLIGAGISFLMFAFCMIGTYDVRQRHGKVKKMKYKHTPSWKQIYRTRFSRTTFLKDLDENQDEEKHEEKKNRTFD